MTIYQTQNPNTQAPLSPLPWVEGKEQLVYKQVVNKNQGGSVMPWAHVTASAMGNITLGEGGMNSVK